MDSFSKTFEKLKDINKPNSNGIQTGEKELVIQKTSTIVDRINVEALPKMIEQVKVGGYTLEGACCELQQQVATIR